MINFENFNGGFILGNVYGLRQDILDHTDCDIYEKIRNLCVFSLKEINTPTKKIQKPSLESNQIISVYLNIIKRGLPTFSSLFIERKLVRLTKNIVKIDEHKDSGEIVFRFDQFIGREKEDWFEIISELVSSIQDKISIYPITENEQAAALLILSPLAIAQIQRGILYALEMNYISLEMDKWEIIVIENNIPCAELAFQDFLINLQALYRLLNSELHLPKIVLTIISTDKFSGFIGPDIGSPDVCCDLNIKRMGLDQFNDLNNKVDLIFEIHRSSDDANPDLYQNDYSHNLLATGSAFSINPIEIFQDARKVNATERIEYPISKDFTANVLYFLQNIFRKCDFWGGQIEILSRSLRLEPVIGLLPTGAGKSLCYQLSVLLQPGVSIIIGPLLSLMTDQVENLCKNYLIDNVVMISSLSSRDIREHNTEIMMRGGFQFIFISPERLQSREFREGLKTLSENIPTHYLVVDEAHCVSEWGHDFRTSYLNMSHTVKELCVYNGNSPAIIALTGTASYSVLEDVQREIGIVDVEAMIFPYSFDRPELKFELINVTTFQKRNTLLDLLRRLPDMLHKEADVFFEKKGSETNVGIVFCPHVKGFLGVNDNASAIKRELGIQTETYSGNGTTNKTKIHRDFSNNKIPLLVATKSFGMGIDKPNIRYTIHYNIPPSLEEFYQEAGRAGRDRKEAFCVIIFSDDDPNEANQYLDINLNADELHEMPDPGYGRGGDVHRLMWFHKNEFIGIKEEFKEIRKILSDRGFGVYTMLGNTSEGKTITKEIPFGEDRNKREKALYRLGIIGVVQDYTLEFLTESFEVQFIRRKPLEYIANIERYIKRYKSYNQMLDIKEKIENQNVSGILYKCTLFLLNFVYQEIENKRRTAIRTMLEVCREASALVERDVFIRKEILAYLDVSPFINPLLSVAQTSNSKEWWNVFHLSKNLDYSKILSISNPRELLGGCRRLLESYPEHPGLNFISGITRVLLPKPDLILAGEDFKRGFHGMDQFDNGYQESVGMELIKNLQGWGRYVPDIQGMVSSAENIFIEAVPTRKIARTLFDEAPKTSKMVLKNLLLGEIKELNAILWEGRDK